MSWQTKAIEFVALVTFVISETSISFGMAQADEPTVATPETPYVSADSGQVRMTNNARYVGVPVTTTVTQRFEMYDPHSEAALQELKSMGFTQVILDWPTLHEAATDLGMDVVLANWWIDTTPTADIDQAIELARSVDRNRLTGFSVMDEPGRNSPNTPFQFYVDLYARLKPLFRKEFPNTRLEISHWGPMASWGDRFYNDFAKLYKAADVMRIMPYPDLHEAPLDDVFFMIQRSRRLMRIAEAEIPLVVILQTWVLPPKNKLPTIAELRAMAYQAMLSGAETLSFFEYNLEVWDRTPEFKPAFRQLMAELTGFSQRYQDFNVETTMEVDGLLTSKLTSPTGTRRRVEINTQRNPLKDFAPLEVRITILAPTPPPATPIAAAGSMAATHRHCVQNYRVSPGGISACRNHRHSQNQNRQPCARRHR